MPKYHPKNERIKHEYFEYLREAMGQAEASVDAAAKALSRFEEDTNCRDFRKFNRNMAVSFKASLCEQKSQVTGKALSKATMTATLAHVKRFFFWLIRDPGYRAQLKVNDFEYFNPSANELRAATAKRDKKYPCVEELCKTIAAMPSATDIQRRDRAIFAFTMLTAARVGAIASLKLKHIDLANKHVYQDGREVRTKFGKSFNTYFVEVAPGIREFFEEWVRYLREAKGWGDDAPLFPSPQIALNDQHQFAVVGLEQVHWNTTGPIRAIFRDAFKRAGVPYYNPHSFRDMLTRLGKNRCHSIEEFKAWSQNLGHEHIMTTLLNYGDMEPARQREIIRDLNQPRPSSQDGLSEQERTALLPLLKLLRAGALAGTKCDESVPGKS